MTFQKSPGPIASSVSSTLSLGCLGREPEGDLTHRGIPVSLLLQARCGAWSVQRACRCQWLREDDAAGYSCTARGSPHGESMQCRLPGKPAFARLPASAYLDGTDLSGPR